MNVNETYHVEIVGASSDWRGIARVEGQVLFVPGALPGERCLVRVVNIGKTAAHGKLLRVEAASPHRIEPDCPYFPACGGCGLENLKITGAAEQDGYRNKVQYPVQEQNGRAEAGFFSAGTHRVIPIAHCRIQPDCADAIRAAVLRWMAQYKIRAYDEKTGRGFIRHIYIRRGAVSGETLVCISANCKQLPRSAELTAAIRAAAPDVTSIVFTPNEKKGNTILGDTFLPLYGPGWIQDTLCGLTFRLSPAAFYQVNHDQAEILYRKALQFAALTGTETVLDLYCGTGTITLCLAREAGRAVGVEVVPQAIEDAKENAKRNGLADKTEFYCMDAGQAAQMFAARGERPDVIVVDPPRKGVSPDVIEAMAAIGPRRIVYVSCDPATLARDVKLLRERGYALQTAEAVDLFPRCAHIETVCLLSKLQSKEHIEIEVKMDEMDLTSAESKATYEEIREYVLEHTGLKVSHLYIAQVKQKYGIIERENYNKPKSENAKQPQCPAEKEKAITEALRHFGMIL